MTAFLGPVCAIDLPPQANGAGLSELVRVPFIRIGHNKGLALGQALGQQATAATPKSQKGRLPPSTWRDAPFPKQVGVVFDGNIVSERGEERISSPITSHRLILTKKNRISYVDNFGVVKSQSAQ